MNFLHALKEAQYIWQTLMGLSWLALSLYMFCKPDANLICDTVPAIFMFVTGSVCVFFGVEAYLLRDDPEIWR
ncbi:hypothetical protein KBI23_09820 [bacterium]|nr:hypothetical protein [bacterium]MBP9808583.1 hypothetical protein [bacterium]